MDDLLDIDPSKLIGSNSECPGKSFDSNREWHLCEFPEKFPDKSSNWGASTMRCAKCRIVMAGLAYVQPERVIEVGYRTTEVYPELPELMETRDFVMFMAEKEQDPAFVVMQKAFAKQELDSIMSINKEEI